MLCNEGKLDKSSWVIIPDTNEIKKEIIGFIDGFIKVRFLYMSSIFLFYH